MDGEALQAVLDEARALGAKGAEVLVREARTKQTSWRDGAGEPTAESQEAGLVVRVWLEGGRQGSAKGAWSRLNYHLKAAISAAERAPEDPHSGPAPRLSGAASSLGIDDKRYPTITDEDRLALLQDAARAARQAEKGLQIGEFSLEDVFERRLFASSRGVSHEGNATTWRARGVVSGRSPEGEITRVGEVWARTYASVAALPFGVKAARQVAQLVKLPQGALSGPVRVVLMPPAVAALIAPLAERFVDGMLGSERFFVVPHRHGAPVLDEKLHLVDDGALHGGLRTRGFDDRGVPSVPLNLLREGRPEGLLRDVDGANESDSRPSGHLWGDQLRPNNLLLRGGTRSVSASLADFGGASVVVDELPDVSGIVWRSGRAKLPIDAIQYQGNKPVAAVRGRLLTGQLREVLNQVLELHSDTDRVAHVDAPAITVEGFTLE